MSEVWCELKNVPQSVAVRQWGWQRRQCRRTTGRAVVLTFVIPVTIAVVDIFINNIFYIHSVPPTTLVSEAGVQKCRHWRQYCQTLRFIVVRCQKGWVWWRRVALVIFRIRSNIHQTESRTGLIDNTTTIHAHLRTLLAIWHKQRLLRLIDSNPCHSSYHSWIGWTD